MRKARVIVTNPQRKAMRLLREQGLTIRQIHARFPQSSRYAVEAHVAGIRSKHRVAPEQRASMRAMRASGMTIEAIQGCFSQFLYQTIWRHTRDVQVSGPLRRRRRVDPLAVLRLREEGGLKFEAIGKRFGVTKVAACKAYWAAKGERRA